MRFPSVDFAARVLNGAVQFPCCSLPDSSVHSSGFLHSAVQLRCYPQRQLGLRCFCQLWRALKRSVQPGKKIPVNKQLVSQKGGQIRKRPSEGRQQLQVTQNQHSNQRRPNLGFDRIRVCPEERFDLQVLFDRLERLTDILPINMILTKLRSNTVFTPFEVGISRSSGCIWCMRNHPMLYGKQTGQLSHFRPG